MPRSFRILLRLSRAPLPTHVPNVIPRFLSRRGAHPAERQPTIEAPAEPQHEQFQTLLEGCPDGILVHRGGVVLYANPASARLWGTDRPSELVGRSVLDLVNRESREAVKGRIEALQRGEPFGVLEQQITRSNGVVVDVESSAAVITWNGESAVEAVVRDITERKRKERDLLQLQERLAAEAIDMGWIHELSLRLSSHLDLQWVLREVLAGVVTLQGANAGVLMLFDREGQDLYTVASLGLSDQYLDQVGRVPVGAGACGAAIERRGSVVVNDVEADPLFAPYRDAARTGGYRAVYSCPFFSRSGEALGTIATYFRDRRSPSEREIALVERYAQQAVQFIENARLYEQTQQALEARDEVLAIVSHDLRNPVGMISTCADLLMDESYPPDKRRRQVEIIKRSADRMNRLIEDLLDVSVIEAGRLSLEREVLDTVSLAREACETIEQIAGRKALRSECSIPDSLPALHADRDRLLQVLGNLIGNAVKFTAEGGLVGLRVAAHHNEVEFVVADTGPGIPEAHREHIFNRYWQAKHTARTGAGLGLAIAKGIVEAHGGRIWVESEVGRGSSFHFALPAVGPADG